MRFIFKLFVLITLGVGFYYFLFRSEYFKIKNCELKNGSSLTLEDLKKNHLLPIGENIWLIDEESIAFEIEKRWFVKVLEIRKKYPSSLIIRLEDQIPIAIVRAPNGLWLISVRGLLWPVLSVGKEYMKSLPKGLCVVTYYKEIVWFPGKETEDPNLINLLKLFSFLEKIEEVYIKENCFQIKKEDCEIFLPRSGDVSLSMYKLDKVRSKFPAKGKGLIFDLRFSDMVIVRERER
ncbi:MAG: FtsQ-type POTRA domain-containing protein [Synergistetes bacterium]|nr:FtsQ-type POTRA domain-containing protein [Synergistota bacterium]MDW8192042.1 FtsQ-type POTRA domain-containing protein [Synergistota bacterium]